MSARTETATARTRLLGELTRSIGSALAAESVENDRAHPQSVMLDGDRHLARVTAASEVARIRTLVTSAELDSMSDAEERGLIEEAVSQVLGLGRLDLLLADDEVSDIHVRGSAPVWVRLRDGARRERPPVVDSDDELVELIRRAATRLGRNERRFDPANPELNIQLPDGSRMFAAMEVSMRPMLVIRKHRFEFSSLDELSARGMFDASVSSFLASAVRARRNIVLAGGTGSGKTTLLRALINEVPRHERIVTIEDAYELGLDRFEHLHPDYDCLQARPANIEGAGEVTMADLTKMALRMDPDRVVVGEVRGAEAFPMLMAMSQGNNGSMCTMHADSTRTVFPKLAAYVSMASMGLPTETVNMLIASAVHYVVHIEIVDGDRRVSSIREVVDADGVSIISNEIFAAEDGAHSFSTLRSRSFAVLQEHGFVHREPANEEPERRARWKS